MMSDYTVTPGREIFVSIPPDGLDRLQKITAIQRPTVVTYGGKTLKLAVGESATVVDGVLMKSAAA